MKPALRRGPALGSDPKRGIGDVHAADPARWPRAGQVGASGNPAGCEAGPAVFDAVAGTPSQCLEGFQAYREVGVTGSGCGSLETVGSKKLEHRAL